MYRLYPYLLKKPCENHYLNIHVCCDVIVYIYICFFLFLTMPSGQRFVAEIKFSSVQFSSENSKMNDDVML